jgi:hypothetical protein
LHDTYGGFIDAFVLDALYANGPVMTQLDGYGYGGFIVLKKDNNEPLQEALALWQDQGPCEEYRDPEKEERIRFWDCDDLETLDTYQGKVKVVRAVVAKPGKEPSTWCFAIIGQRARQLARRTTLRIVRARWHIEDTGFNQWIQYWEFRARVPTHAECSNGHPTSLDSRLQSASAIHLSAAGSFPPTERSYRHHSAHRRGHAS